MSYILLSLKLRFLLPVIKPFTLIGRLVAIILLNTRQMEALVQFLRIQYPWEAILR